METSGRENARTGQSQDKMEELCQDYCPPLEAGLVYALASDFDLDSSSSLLELKQVLDDLRDSAAIEQDLELLPQDHDEGDNAVVEASKQKAHLGDISTHTSGSGPRKALDQDTISSITTGLSGLKHSNTSQSDFSQGSGYGEAGLDFNALSDSGKSKSLASMFPNVGVADIKDILVRCDGDFDRCTDELLNISFIRDTNEDIGDQEYTVLKGIDAFLQDDKAGSQLKPKSKRKGGHRSKGTHKANSSETWISDSAMSSGTATPNVWKDLPQDVEFIAARTSLKPKSIASLYHANGARLAPTVRALAIREGEVYARSPHKVDDIIEWQMDELRSEFDHIPDAQIYGALMVANKMPSAAKDLLDAMCKSNEQPVFLGKVTGLATYTPVNLSEDEARPKKGQANKQLLPIDPGAYTTSHLANTHGQDATQAFQQASAAYRRGKSDHLMGGAAAYYASVGHEKIKAAKSVQAAAADAHVAAQSSSLVLDLHGVNVSDAVRIAQNATEAWWEGLGDRKYVIGGKGDGYRIVTGVGRHSSDGIGRIGPAVSKTLVREGWRVEVGRGEIIISGRARR